MQEEVKPGRIKGYMDFIECTLEKPLGLEDLLTDLGTGENGFGGTDYGNPAFDISLYLKSITEMSKGIGLKPGYVPQTTYWLISDCGKAIGISRLRHHLTPVLLAKCGHIAYYVKKDERGKGLATKLIEKTIEKAHQMGIEDILITADEDNLASKKAILKCGGKLEDERIDETINKKYGRYWIRCSYVVDL